MVKLPAKEAGERSSPEFKAEAVRLCRMGDRDDRAGRGGPGSDGDSRA